MTFFGKQWMMKIQRCRSAMRRSRLKIGVKNSWKCWGFVKIKFLDKKWRFRTVCLISLILARKLIILPQIFFFFSFLAWKLLLISYLWYLWFWRENCYKLIIYLAQNFSYFFYLGVKIVMFFIFMIFSILARKLLLIWSKTFDFFSSKNKEKK